MGIDLTSRPPHIPSKQEEAIVAEGLQIFGQVRSVRATFEGHWEEVANLLDPNQRNTFTVGSMTTAGEKNTDKQVDASGMVALSRFSAICDSLLTPRNMKWHALSADDDYVMKDRATQLWFADTTNKLFKHRYAPNANFAAQNQGVYKNLGAYGTGPMFIDKFFNPRIRGLRYKALPLGETFLIENHQGLVNGFVRFFRRTAKQAYEQWPNTFPDALVNALKADSQQKFDFIHCVLPRDNYDPERADAEGKPFKSYYICLTSKTVCYDPDVGMMGGYNSFPLSAGRYEQYVNDGPYGRSPAMMVLPALKTLNAEKRVFLKQGHRAADPILLLSDDGMMDMSMRPGALVPGGWSADGKPLVGTLPTGDIQITKEMMADEKTLINDTFLVTLFQILTETPTMTATEVIERTNEKGILLAPTVGRQQSEYLGPMIDRELDLLSEMGILEPMPPRLKEAGGSYSVIYTSPLSRAMRAQEAAGFMRTLESIKELVNITQDPSLLDPFDFDVAIPEIAEIQAVPPTWMASADKIAAKREGRAQRADRQEQIQAMPAQAAMMKAQAVAQEKAPVAPA